MTVIIFFRKHFKTGERIKELVETVLFSKRVEVFHTIEDVSARLRQLGDRSLIILLAENREDLLRLSTLRDLMDDVNIVLFLPDNGKDTLAMGLRLYPRYVGYLDEDLSDLQLILKKMAAPKSGKKNAECFREGRS